QARRLTAQHSESLQGGIQLAYATIDEQNIGEDIFFLVSPTEAARDYFADRCKVVNAFHGTDAIAPIPGLERQPVDEPHERSDCLLTAKVGNVHAFNSPWHHGQAQDLT